MTNERKQKIVDFTSELSDFEICQLIGMLNDIRSYGK